MAVAVRHADGLELAQSLKPGPGGFHDAAPYCEVRLDCGGEFLGCVRDRLHTIGGDTLAEIGALHDRQQVSLFSQFGDYERKTTRTIPVVRLTRAN